MKNPTPAGFGRIEWSTSGPHPVGWPTKTEGFQYHLQIWVRPFHERRTHLELVFLLEWGEVESSQGWRFYHVHCTTQCLSADAQWGMEKW